MFARPQTIGPYRLDSRLGAGGMGEVYRAYDERLHRWVAIKLIRPESSEDATARERFRREARAAAGLTHSAIVQIHDIVESEQGDAIVMELVEGESLAGRLASGLLPLAEAVRLGREITTGLAAAHARGIVHRDLKAENVMITADGHAKILDFGLAKQLEGEASLTEGHRLVGTVRCMSPEQARGLPVDHRSDLFSLGILLYEMLSGRSPFEGDSTLDTLTRICTHRQKPLREIVAGIPDELSKLIDHLLQKDPHLRPHTARGVLAGLTAEPSNGAETLVDGPRPDLVIPPTTGSQGYTTPRRGLRWASLIALLVLLTAALWWRIEQPAPEPPRPRAPHALAALPAAPVYVAVPKPESAEELQILAASLRTAVLQGLLTLEGVLPIASEQVDEVAAPPVELARKLGVDEVVTSRLDCVEETCQVSLNRIHKDGRLLWTQSFSALAARPFELATTVQSHLTAGYADHPLRSEALGLEVRPEDYAEYLHLLLGAEPPEILFNRLAAIRETSPRFLEAWLLEADIRQRVYKSSQDPEDLEQAAQLLGQAHRMAPVDPRPLAGQFGVAMLRADLGRAGEVLTDLEALQPGEAMVLINRARLLEKQGEVEEALTLMREGVRRLPSWRNLYRSADMNYRHGRFAAARRDLEALLQSYPDKREGLTLLAQVELLHGSTRRAAEIYAKLVEQSPASPGLFELSNLGVALLYLADYPKAEATFRKALELEPQNPFNLLGLADTLHLQERTREAADVYRSLVEATEADPADWQVLSARAQAQAHLGDGPGAVEAVQQMLRKAPDGPQTAYEASLVYTLLGESTTALFNARRALEQGVAPKLFDLPWFEPLKTDPQFSQALAQRAGP